MPIQPTGAKDVQGQIIIHPEYEQGLSNIDGFSHLILLYHFHQSKGFDVKTENVRSGWLEENQVKAQTMTSDSRFI